MILKNKKVSMLGVNADNILAKDITRGIKNNRNYSNTTLHNLYRSRRKLQADKNFKRFQTLEYYLKKKNLPITLEGFKELIKIQSHGPKRLFKKSSKQKIIKIFEQYKFKTTTEAKTFYSRFINLPKQSTIYISNKELRETYVIGGRRFK